MPEHSIINMKNVSHQIHAQLLLERSLTQGVVACQGGNMGGWSLYFDESGFPTYLYNWFGHELTFLTSSTVLEPGSHELTLLYIHDGGFGAGGTASLSVNDEMVASEKIPATVPVIYSMSGETFDVGRDTGSPVGPYPHNFAFNGQIIGVTLERLSDSSASTKKAERQGRFKASLSSQ
jgi:arylsulfatase